VLHGPMTCLGSTVRRRCRLSSVFPLTASYSRALRVWRGIGGDSGKTGDDYHSRSKGDSTVCKAVQRREIWQVIVPR
jgi:hypothetical protein